MDHLFQDKDQATRVDFISQCEALKIIDLSAGDIGDTTDFLCVQVDGGMFVPYKNFEHYANKVHSDDDFILGDDHERLRRICKVILDQKVDLKTKFDGKVQPYQHIRMFIHVLGFPFEDTDKVLLHVLRL